ncbi:hypothetical protein FHX06_006695 [Rhizobium sp. BK512]|uniref:hypothetical protein n=1 Tax=Rhizobium sp. BK512 TaxID=2587010 RepID=UPI000DDA4423|nr:hypothetical protein [Rhizobium sp. BK512]MBB3565325.1 hypothetical protein [Rhizobium sp. BK512]
MRQLAKNFSDQEAKHEQALTGARRPVYSNVRDVSRHHIGATFANDRLVEDEDSSLRQEAISGQQYLREVRAFATAELDRIFTVEPIRSLAAPASLSAIQ